MSVNIKRELKNDIFSWILKNGVVDETNQPEDKDKDEEKHRIDDPDEGLAEINLPVSLILGPCLGLGDWSLSESMYEGLHQGVHYTYLSYRMSREENIYSFVWKPTSSTYNVNISIILNIF